MPATNKTLFHKAEITNMMTVRLFEIMFDVTVSVDGFGGLVVNILATGTQVLGFKPGRSRWIPSEGK